MWRPLLRQGKQLAKVAFAAKLRKGVLAPSLAQLQIHKRGITEDATLKQYRNLGPQETTQFSSDFVEVVFNGQNLKFANIWLRDHCRCEDCFHPSLLQRKISIKDISPSVQPSDVTRINNILEVSWTDGHVSKFELEWLAEHCFPGRHTRTKKLLWDQETIVQHNIPKITYNEFMSNDKYVKAHLQNILKFGFSFIVDVPVSFDETVKCAERIGFTLETFYGKNWQFQADMSRSDKSFTNMALAAHTDTTFLPIPAGLQLLHCLFHDGEGGDNLIVDGYYCAEKLRQEDPEAFAMLRDERIPHEFFEVATNTNTACLDSLLKTHPATDEVIWLRYSEFDRAPLTTIPQERVAKYYESMVKMANIIEDPANEHWVKLEPGTIIFMDNWRLLHGRSSFTGKRHMCGTYLPREYWMGKAKLLGLV